MKMTKEIVAKQREIVAAQARVSRAEFKTQWETRTLRKLQFEMETLTKNVCEGLQTLLNAYEKQLVDGGGKLSAIKSLRGRTDMSLTEAKDHCDAYEGRRPYVARVVRATTGY